MMSKFKKLYRDFFGLNEQTQGATGISVSPEKVNDPNVQDLIKKGMKVRIEGEIDEAQLVNNLTDYRGGIEYVLRDPATAQSVAQEIQEWAERKGFTVVKKTLSPTGKIGYFYFRLGQDPALESQKLQGYLAQKPELKHFRFNVRQQAAKKPQEKI
jgi:hypothetical protein